MHPKATRVALAGTHGTWLMGSAMGWQVQRFASAGGFGLFFF